MSAVAVEKQRKITPNIFTGNKFKVIAFGGSIGGSDVATGSSRQNTPLKRYLKDAVRLNDFLDVKVNGKLTQKDSSQVNSSDLQELMDKIIQTKQSEIIVTMGMTRLVEFSRYLKNNLPKEILQQKSIIMTASHDLHCLIPSDAGCQLGYAAGVRFQGRKGVQIALSLGVYDPDEIILCPDRTIEFIDKKKELSTANFSDTIVLGMGGTIENIELDIALSMERGYFHKYINETVNPKQPPFFHTIRMVDSTELVSEDITKLKACIMAATQKNIVFTVGTNFAAEVLEELNQDEELIAHLEEKDKVVIAASAMTLPTRSDSDATFSLGFALGVVAELEPGLYQTIHGIVAEPGALQKNRAANRFEQIID